MLVNFVAGCVFGGSVGTSCAHCRLQHSHSGTVMDPVKIGSPENLRKFLDLKICMCDEVLVRVRSLPV